MRFPIVQCSLRDVPAVPLPFVHRKVQTLLASDPKHTPYGQVLRDQWDMCGNVPGMLWLEADIAIGPEHLDELERAVAADDGTVVAVPFRLYPASTRQPRVVWPFYERLPDGREQIIDARLSVPRHPLTFGLGCTYLPARLLECARSHLHDWDWPSLDWRLATLARHEGIPVVTTETPAIHLHYDWPLCLETRD